LKGERTINSHQKGSQDFLGLSRKQAQEDPEPGQDLPQVVPNHAEERIDRITFHVLEEVPPENFIAFHVANRELDGGSSANVVTGCVAALFEVNGKDHSTYV